MNDSRGSSIFSPDLLAGHVALVTGAGTGLGRATAIELAAAGATVVLGARREDLLRETADLIEAAGGVSSVDPVDVRDEKSVESFVAGALKRHERIDTLVNNAGGQFFGPAEDITPNGFRAVVDLNLTGTWLMTNAVANQWMIPSGDGGKIISVTLSPHHGLPGMVHSSAARAGVENLMRSLSVEWARYGITTAAVASGHFQTNALAKYPEAFSGQIAKTVPAGRLGRPQEQGWLIAYLASHAGDFISGTTITIDGARDNWIGAWPPPEFATASGKPPAETKKPATR